MFSYMTRLKHDDKLGVELPVPSYDMQLPIPNIRGNHPIACSGMYKQKAGPPSLENNEVPYVASVWQAEE